MISDLRFCTLISELLDGSSVLAESHYPYLNDGILIIRTTSLSVTVCFWFICHSQICIFFYKCKKFWRILV